MIGTVLNWSQRGNVVVTQPLECTVYMTDWDRWTPQSRLQMIPSKNIYNCKTITENNHQLINQSDNLVNEYKHSHDLPQQCYPPRNPQYFSSETLSPSLICLSLCCPLQARRCMAGCCGTLSRTWTQPTNYSWRKSTCAQAGTATYPSSIPRGHSTMRGHSTAAFSPTRTSNTVSYFW